MDAVNRLDGTRLSDAIERKSRLVSVAYEVLGNMDLPPLEASEGEMLAALVSAFQRRALDAAAVQLHKPRGKPALPERPPDNQRVSVFEKRMRWSSPPR